MDGGTRADKPSCVSVYGGQLKRVAALLIALFAAIVLALVVVGLSRPQRGDRRYGSDEDSGGDDGGSKPRVPPPHPPNSPDDAEPEWWPEFEREFADYARRARSPQRADDRDPVR